MSETIRAFPSLESAGAVRPVESYAPSAGVLALWAAVYDSLRSEFGEAAFRSWLKPLTLQACYHGTLEVSVPTRFMRDWIQNHYATRILELCTALDADIRRLEIVVVHSAMPVEEPAPAIRERTLKANQNVENSPLQDLSSPLDPRFTFETFVVGKPNALAHAAARRVVESGGVPFNPLFIYGGVGLGKTHLMHAIAWAMRAHWPEKRVMVLSAEKFMYQFVRALRSQDMFSFKEVLRSVDVLLMDDIQFISGKESTQDEFFHTFNALVDQNKQIIISSDRMPDAIPTL
ncbi:MAG TPA: DnaA/Hda family protein, partial [Alphaproteobacteria bacterium]|nr:DnaA/Hda family protein [Alphaproteobacteria bacterium]